MSCFGVSEGEVGLAGRWHIDCVKLLLVLGHGISHPSGVAAQLSQTLPKPQYTVVVIVRRTPRSCNAISLIDDGRSSNSNCAAGNNPADTSTAVGDSERWALNI
jgi:hypothetical protein